MVKKMLVILLSQVFFLMMLSCAGKHGVETNKMYLIMGDYHRRILTFRETTGNKVVEEKVILDLTKPPGPRVVQAGFLSSNVIYVVFEGIQEAPKWNEMKIYIQMYDIVNSSWSNISVYKSTDDNIRIMDVENTGGYFSGYRKRNALFYWDFNTHENKMVLELPGDEGIVAINCRSNERFVVINSYDEKEDIYRYYCIDKNTYEKTYDGYGRIYANKFGNFMILGADSKIYVVDNLINVQSKIEIPVDDKKIFSKAIDAGENSFVICSYSTLPDYISRFLFGGWHVIERYEYKAIQVYKDDKTGFGYENIYKFGNYFRDKKLFDALIIKDGI